MKQLKYVVLAIIVVSFFYTDAVIESEPAEAQFTINIPGLRIRGPRKRRVRRQPSEFAGHARWYSTRRQGVETALNDEGVMISMDDRGNLIIVAALRNPSGRDAGSRLPVEVSFNKRFFGSYTATQLEGRYVGIAGADVYSLIEKFKTSRQFKIEVAGNVFKTHLSGSGKAIKAIERAARARREYLMDNSGKEIRDAKVQYMISRHKKKVASLVDKAVIDGQQRDGSRPGNFNMKTDIRRANEPEIKVKYYVPGTKTVGVMWINSDVIAKKGLVIKLNFVDPGAKFDQIAHTVELLPNEAAEMASLLAKGKKWTDVAQKNKVGLFQKVIGIVSGEEGAKNYVAVKFNSYEDASTSVQVEETIAGYPKRFNFAIHNGLELATYLHEVVARARRDFESKKMSKEEKTKLFD